MPRGAILTKPQVFGLLSNLIRNGFILSGVLVHYIFNISVIQLSLQYKQHFCDNDGSLILKLHFE